MNLKMLIAGMLGILMLSTAAAAEECGDAAKTKKVVITLSSEAIQSAGFGLAVANAMQDAGVQSTVFVAADAVPYVLKRGEQPEFGGTTPRNLIVSLLKKGGKVWLCGGFAKMKGIETSDLVQGVGIAGPADLAGALLDPGAQAMTF